MDKFDRIFQLTHILEGRRTPIAMADLTARLECSKATVFRTIKSVERYLGARIGLDPRQIGYQYLVGPDGLCHQLPGLWFSPKELQALVVFQRLLSSMDPGLLNDYLAPVSKRIIKLVEHKRLRLTEVASRIRILTAGRRAIGISFQAVASATLQRRKLTISYHSRGKDEYSERVISPQRVSHYRDNWYLDAWDELRSALRSFSIDRIREAKELSEKAADIPDDELDRHYASAYGIFAGPADSIAVLRFTGKRARWVADEQWHPLQQSRFLPDGSFELRFPFGDTPELVMDVLKHGADVEVIEPLPLREAVRDALSAALRRYST